MVKKKAIIVVGLGYGDEGKGLTTDYLCLLNKKSIVIRFNGGHQAAHCVVTNDGRKHIFSNFCSGSFRGMPSFWSSFCSFEPTFFIEEFNQLDIEPRIFIDKDCPITTHYDVLYNRAIETTRGNLRNGSCGVGYGATIERQKNSDVSLSFKDILKPDILKRKLKLIRNYYKEKINNETGFDFDSFAHDIEDTTFIDSIKKINKLISKNIVTPIFENEIFSKTTPWETYIFEGAQGILLDKDFGIKPHITQSNTTSKNALTIISRQKALSFNTEIFYVTRAYQTRHGAGPFRETDQEFKLYNNIHETNKTNEFQGEFRCNYLDINMLNYALICDNKFSKHIPKNLMITCLDHLNNDEIVFIKNDVKKKLNYKEIKNELICNFKSVKYSFNNCAEFLIHYEHDSITN
jgi:adenylosuccinate synthase